MTDYNDESTGSVKKSGTADSQPGPESRNTPAMIEKFVIRLPKGLRNKIKHLSEQNRRSMNSEIIMVLEKHIQQNLSDTLTSAETESLAKSFLDAATESLETSQQSDSELTRRLQNLPEEKKQALLELLG